MAPDPRAVPAGPVPAGPVPARRDHRRVTRWALLLVLAAIGATFWSAAAGAVLACVAIGVAIWALVLTTGAHGRLFPAVLAVVLAPVVLLVAGLLALVQLVFGAELDRYEQCLAGANTRTSEALCRDELQSAVTGRL